MAFKQVNAAAKQTKKIGVISEAQNAEMVMEFETDLVLYDRASGKYFKLKKAVNKVDNIFEVDFENKDQVEYLGKD